MKHVLTFALIGVLAIGLATEARADPVVFDFTGAPEFSNSGAPALIGSVKVTITDIAGGVEIKTEVSGLNSSAKLFNLYLNVDPYMAGSASGAWINLDTFARGPDAFKADGDGYFDWRLEFVNGFNSGTALLGVTGTGLDSTDFLAVSQPGAGSDPSKGPYYAAIHVGDVDGIDSGWYAATTGDTPPIPEPGSLALMGLGVLGLVWYRRRKST